MCAHTFTTICSCILPPVSRDACDCESMQQAVQPAKKLLGADIRRAMWTCNPSSYKQTILNEIDSSFAPIERRTDMPTWKYTIKPTCVLFLCAYVNEGCRLIYTFCPPLIYQSIDLSECEFTFLRYYHSATRISIVAAVLSCSLDVPCGNRMNAQAGHLFNLEMTCPVGHTTKSSVPAGCLYNSQLFDTRPPVSITVSQKRNLTYNA